VQCLPSLTVGYLDDPLLPQLRVGTAWAEVEVKSEAAVRYTRRGYAPCLLVTREGYPHVLFVSAVSLTEPLESVRKERGGTLEGARLRIRKASAEPAAAYQVEVVEV
jgi:hypothetical protein